MTMIACKRCAEEHEQGDGVSSRATGVVITCPEKGVYLGCFLGLGFWTLLDCADQTHACVFASERQARTFVISWDEGGDPDAYAYPAVQCAHAYCASFDELVCSGIDSALLGALGRTNTRLH